MTATKPTFKSIDFGTTVSAVSEFAKEQGVPSLVFPSENAESSTAVASLPPARHAMKAKVPTTQSSPTRRLAVELPEYLIKAVSDKAHSGDTTIRYVITHALQKAGFFVDAADLLEDGRRGR